jgi:hypothetical protein
MLRDAGGIPAYGNQRSEWDAGCRFDFDNPNTPVSARCANSEVRRMRTQFLTDGLPLAGRGGGSERSGPEECSGGL